MTLTNRTDRPPTCWWPYIERTSYAAPSGSLNGWDHATVTFVPGDSVPSEKDSEHVWFRGCGATSPGRSRASNQRRSSARGSPTARGSAAHARALYSPAHAAPSTAGLELTMRVVCIGASEVSFRIASGTFASASGLFGNHVTLYRIPNGAANAVGSARAAEPGASGASAPSPQHWIPPPGERAVVPVSRRPRRPSRVRLAVALHRVRQRLHVA